MTLLQVIFRIIFIGIGATAIMDLWLIFIKRMGAPTLNFAFIGRWVGHLFRGKLTHAAISMAAPIPGELALGWFMHYATGIVGVAPDAVARRCRGRGYGAGAALRHAASHGRRICVIQNADAVEELPSQPGQSHGVWHGALPVRSACRCHRSRRLTF